MGASRWLFWHRRDLRLADNQGLAALRQRTPVVTGVFVLDPAILTDPGMAPARLWFLRESLVELAESWRRAGSRLLLLQGDPAELLPRLAQALAAEGVAWNRDVEPYGIRRDRRVLTALEAAGLQSAHGWDQLMVPPEALRTGGGDPYRVYGPFLRNWRGQVERRAVAGELVPTEAPQGLIDCSSEALSAERRALWEQLPLLAAVPPELGAGFSGVDLCPCRPGERAAWEQLQAFCDGSGPGGGGWSRPDSPAGLRAGPQSPC